MGVDPEAEWEPGRLYRVLEAQDPGKFRVKRERLIDAQSAPAPNDSPFTALS
jgi:hypothetical protein